MTTQTVSAAMMQQRRRVLTGCCVLLGLALLPFLVPGTNTRLFLAMQTLTMMVPDDFWFIATQFGEPLMLLPFLVLWKRCTPHSIKVILCMLLVGTILVHSPKRLIHELRPHAVLGDVVHQIGANLVRHSFPSGHSATAFAIGGFVFLYGLTGWRIGGLIVAATIALSRVAVGAHWPLDVLVGTLMGLVSVLVGQSLAERWSWQPSDKAWRRFQIFVIVLALIWIPGQIKLLGHLS